MVLFIFFCSVLWWLLPARARVQQVGALHMPLASVPLLLGRCFVRKGWSGSCYFSFEVLRSDW
jgi:hypothetical protein